MKKSGKILIVDDQSLLLKALVLKFEKKFGAVRTASDGKETLNILKRFVPDIIILDIIMPGMDGIELLKEIRRMKKFKKTPIIVFTNLAPDTHKQAALDAGADLFIEKNEISLEQFYEILKKYIQ